MALEFLNWNLEMLIFAYRCHAVNTCGNDAHVYEKVNEDLREGGLDVQAEDIIDIIGGHHNTSPEEDLGGCKHCI